MEKVTSKDIQAVAGILEARMKKCGLLGEDSSIIIQQGDKTHGYPFRIFFTGGDLGSGHCNAPLHLSSNGYLGWTKREAMTTLRAIDDTVWMMRNRDNV
jgi:hypothetical protein